MEFKQTGDKYLCTHAATRYYIAGKTYNVVEKGNKKGFIGEDGFFDTLGKTVSTFKKVEDEDTKRKSKGKTATTESSKGDPEKAPQS